MVSLNKTENSAIDWKSSSLALKSGHRGSFDAVDDTQEPMPWFDITEVKLWQITACPTNPDILAHIEQQPLVLVFPSICTMHSLASFSTSKHLVTSAVMIPLMSRERRGRKKTLYQTEPCSQHESNTQFSCGQWLLESCLTHSIWET